MRRLVPALLFTVVVSALVAAPVPKGGEEKLGPPTREQLKQSKNNLKHIVLAMHNYLDVHNTFPQDVTDANGKPILSWRVLLLPYLEKDELFKKFALDEPWDGATNKKLIEQIPEVYAPVRVKVKNKGETFYQGFAGNGALFEPGQRVPIAGVTDGTSNTIAVLEAAEPVVWTKPGDLEFDPNKELPKLGGQFDGDFYVGLCDGSVQFAYGTGLNADEFKKLITRAGGEIADTDKALGDGPKKK